MIATYGLNTVLYATLSSLLVVLLAATSGYAFSRYRFRGHRALLTAHHSNYRCAVSHQSACPLPDGSYDSYSGLPYDDRLFIIIVYVGFFLPLSVWIAKGCSLTPFRVI